MGEGKKANASKNIFCRKYFQWGVKDSFLWN